MPSAKQTFGYLIAVILLSIGIFGAPARADRAYVSNEKDNSISVIDLETFKVVAVWKVGKRPRGILVSEDGNKLYVCASDSDTVQVLDINSGKVIGELPSGEDPEQFALHPNGKLLFVANEDDNMTTVLDVVSGKAVATIPVGVEPEGMAVSPDGRWAVNTSETTNMVHWIDTKLMQVTDNTLVDQRPRYAAFNADGTQLWVSAEIGGTVSIINVADRKLTRKLTFHVRGIEKDKVQPVGIAFSKDGKRAYVALGPANRVAVVDTASYEVLDYLLVGRRVWHLDATPNGNYILTTNGVSGDVSVIDVGKSKVIKTVKVGRYPWGIVSGR